MTTNYPHRSKRTSIALYLILANGISWLCWIPALLIADGQGYLLPTIANLPELIRSRFSTRQHVLLSAVFSLAVYGPLVGAVAATALETGRDGLVRLLRSIARWRVGIRWYATVLLIAFALPLIPIGIGALTGLSPWNSAGLASALATVLPMLLIQMLTSGLGEEPGWRGYLWPHLQTRFPGGKAIWLAGLIWAVWHYPLTTYYRLSQMVDVPLVGMVFAVISDLAGQTMALIGITYIYAWIYNHTRSLFLTILFHALSNVIPALFAVGAQPALTAMMAVMPWIVVWVLERIYGKTQFPGQPASP